MAPAIGIGAMLALSLAACTSGDRPDPCGPGAAADDDGMCFCEPGFHGDPSIECFAHDDPCGEAEARMEHRVCRHEIEDDEQWQLYSLGGGPSDGGARRLGKYLVPVDGEARLPTVFGDANRYRLHYCLMSVAFEPLFPGLTPADYARLILTRAEREFFAGATYEFEQPSATPFGFSVENAKQEQEVLDVDEVYRVYRHLQDRFEPGELAFLPRGDAQEALAATWEDPPFPVASGTDDQVTYELYTAGIAYGRVRLVRDGETPTFGWQDIVVFDDVPLELEGVMAAAITGARQDILSHLNVLSGQRGTPNLYVDDAIEQLSVFEGQLVRLDAIAAGYLIVPASAAEAEAFWVEHRPTAVLGNAPDLEFAALDAFDAIATDTVDDRSTARARFGAKTVGLALLSRLLEPQYQTAGLGVPFHYYDAFMRDNQWSVDLGAGPVSASYAETIAAWLDDPDFRTDAAIRKQRLETLRAEMVGNGEVDPELIAMLRGRIVEEFGSETVMVRVRSSSNAEDTPSFNGAGLYDSVSGCAADSTPDANPQVSACNPDKDTRPLENALAQVWASLWNFGAFEERDYFQIDHSMIAMGATISQQFEDELANGVAFTGNPRDRQDPSFLVNAQDGETDVVAVTPGVTAELSYLQLENGEVVTIERAVASSLVPPGQQVLSDEQLHELGRVLAALALVYPIDFVVESGVKPLLDVEFKITADRGLVIKQARTFVGASIASGPTCGD